MNLITITFYILGGTAAISAIGILLLRNVFYATLLLITCLLSIAGIFILLTAEFVAVTQILVYAGGVVVLIIFGVMLTSKISGKPLIVKNHNWFAGTLTGIFFMVLLIKLFSETTFYSGNGDHGQSKYNSINQIGMLLMTDYVFVFEVAGLLLLMALISASVIASTFNSVKKAK